MKNYKRAERRHKKKVKFLKRLKKWFYNIVDNESRREDEHLAMQGKGYTFLRTTSCPCNCYMCSEYNKYKREPKNKVIKQEFKRHQ